MKIIIFGNGVMANILKDCIKSPDKLVAMIDPLGEIDYNNLKADVIIDFSNYNATKKLLNIAKKNKIPVLIATTGHTQKELDLIKNEKDIKIKMVSNTSMGIRQIHNIVEQLACKLIDYDIEIVEKHHNRKVDSPSGTAMDIAQTIAKNTNYTINTKRDGKREKNEIGISSVRAGNIVGEHSIIFANDDEIIEIKHTALSRRMFAKGAIEIAREFISQL